MKKPTDQQLTAAQDILSQLSFYLEKHEPQAKNEIKAIDETITILEVHKTTN